ncbi:zinc-finger homeodomain protein 4-like [Macadamia integrifolia]|uniref:zinc-finger homeodomain protein 4-like n=1 Tax=Macadamia integrifolia TaxID=60698 RepID=UPI001C52BD1F|nr:zinc-finger homeodomain protein 4-like [Macadamia integrifolia]
MDISNEEAGDQIPIPISSSSYGGGGGQGRGHMIHHHEPTPHPNPHYHIINPSSSSSPPQLPSNGTITPQALEDHMPNYKKVVIRYRECLKNHAVAMGGNATDGCGEFMPSGDEGTLEALKCSACNCHRNFHRKEIEGHHDSSSSDCYHYHHPHLSRKLILGPSPYKGGGGAAAMLCTAEALGYHTTTGGALLHLSSRAAQAHSSHHHMIMSYNMGGGGGGRSLPSESDDQQEEEGNGGINVPIRPPSQLVKKRFRTRFTPEQKEKMLNFAEKVGWRMQKQEEAVVQQFCQEIGVKRRVLKVWMHNNKHNLSKKNATLLS